MPIRAGNLLQRRPHSRRGQRNSQWTRSYITGAPTEECNPSAATADINAGFLAPRSRELLSQAKSLEAKAMALVEREVLLDGSLDRPTMAAIVAEEYFASPEIVAPAVQVVESWATTVEARITWRNGKLGLGYCSISFPGVNFAAGDPTFTVETAEGNWRPSASLPVSKRPLWCTLQAKPPNAGHAIAEVV